MWLGEPGHLGAAVVPGCRRLREHDQIAARLGGLGDQAQVHLEVVLDIRVPDVDLGCGDLEALHLSRAPSGRLARHDDDVVALFGRRDRAHDADDPAVLLRITSGVSVGPLEEVDRPTGSSTSTL